MLEAAFGPGQTVQVYSSQEARVIETLRRGATHVQNWMDTAAYDLADRFRRRAHKRAYRWMEREFTKRIRKPVGAPIWVSFDLTGKLSRQKEGYTILALDVPRSELLLSSYKPWSEDVLDGWCLDHCDEPYGVRLGPPCACTGRRRRESWTGIFDVGGTPADWQGVLDRIEPNWVTKFFE